MQCRVSPADGAAGLQIHICTEHFGLVSKTDSDAVDKVRGVTEDDLGFHKYSRDISGVVERLQVVFSRSWSDLGGGFSLFGSCGVLGVCGGLCWCSGRYFKVYAEHSHKLTWWRFILNKDLKEKGSPDLDPVFQHHITKTVKVFWAEQEPDVMRFQMLKVQCGVSQSTSKQMNKFQI